MVNFGPLAAEIDPVVWGKAIDKEKLSQLGYMTGRNSYWLANVGPLAAEIDPVVWGTPANVNGFHVLAALLHGI